MIRHHNRATRACIAVGTAFLALTSICGCDPDWAKTLDTGRMLPNFILRVVPSEPVSKRDLYAEFRRASAAEGFTSYDGQPVTDRTFSDALYSRSFNWWPQGSASERYRVRFQWIEQAGDSASEFTMHFFNKNMDDFEIEAWIQFRKWKDEILPHSFPHAQIEVVRHPAQYTPADRIGEFSRETGIDVPDI